MSDVAERSRTLRTVREIADDVLFPAALSVDAADRIPESHLDLLAEHGLYGMAAPEDLNTLDLPDFPSVLRVVEMLAGGCLATTFVWVQHHGAVMAADKTENQALRERYLGPLAAGRLRAGMAIGAAVKPGPPLLRAERVDGGYLFDGVAPWVTGWDMIDTIWTAGRDEDGMLVFGLLDAAASDTLSVDPQRMIAVEASRTVRLTFDRHFVPFERVTTTISQDEHRKGEAESLRFTGSLAVGAAARAITLLGDEAGAFPDELDGVRASLLAATPEQVPDARAQCSELALRAAAALAVHQGSSSVLPGTHAERLVREAQFLLVFGSRPGIRAALLDRLTSSALQGPLSNA